MKYQCRTCCHQHVYQPSIDGIKKQFPRRSPSLGSICHHIDVADQIACSFGPGLPVSFSVSYQLWFQPLVLYLGVPGLSPFSSTIDHKICIMFASRIICRTSFTFNHWRLVHLKNHTKMKRRCSANLHDFGFQPFVFGVVYVHPVSESSTLSRQDVEGNDWPLHQLSTFYSTVAAVHSNDLTQTKPGWPKYDITWIY